MKRQALLLLTASVLCLPLIAAARDRIPKDLKVWIVTVPPKPGEPRFFAANYSKYEWVVFVDKGRVAVRRLTPPKAGVSLLPFLIKRGKETLGRQSSVQVDDGWLIGFDAGEWGGSLWHYSPDGGSRYKISDDQVRAFHRTGAGLLALEGLAHMGISSGQLLRLTKNGEGRWTSARFVDLGHGPNVAALAPDGSLIVATTNRLLKVHSSGKMDVLLTDVFWGGLYPNSIAALPSGDIYIGMRHGVARLQPTLAGKLTFLVPNHAFADAEMTL